MYAYSARTLTKGRLVLAFATCLLTLISFTAIGFTGVANAEPVPADCPDGNLCAYTFANYQELLYNATGENDASWADDQSALGRVADNNAWSIFNNSDRDVIVYENANFQGAQLCVHTGTGRSDLRQVHKSTGGTWGDGPGVISSHRFVASC